MKNSWKKNLGCMTVVRFTPQPQPLFKCCTLDAVEFQEKKSQALFQNWPLALAGDCYSINKKDGEILTDQIARLSPTTCSVHATCGNIKQMLSSQTRSVQEVYLLKPGQHHKL